MKNLINQMLEEINKLAMEKQKRDEEYATTVTELLNNITGIFHSKYSNDDEKDSVIYPYVYVRSKTKEILMDMKFREQGEVEKENVATAIKVIIREEQEKEFLEWLTTKALPAFITGKKSKAYCHEK